MIKFILFSTKPNLFTEEITHIKFLLRRSGTESIIVNDRTELILLIPQLSKEESVVMLFASSSDELNDFVNIRQLFGSVSIVLILPEDNTEMLQQAMLLHPVYFMAKNAELSQFSLAVNDLCNIYGKSFAQPVDKYTPYKSIPGAES